MLQSVDKVALLMAQSFVFSNAGHQRFYRRLGQRNAQWTRLSMLLSGMRVFEENFQMFENRSQSILLGHFDRADFIVDLLLRRVTLALQPFL